MKYSDPTHHASRDPIQPLYPRCIRCRLLSTHDSTEPYKPEVRSSPITTTGHYTTASSSPQLHDLSYLRSSPLMHADIRIENLQAVSTGTGALANVHEGKLPVVASQIRDTRLIRITLDLGIPNPFVCQLGVGSCRHGTIDVCIFLRQKNMSR